MPFRFFDPDRRILSPDKLLHAVGGFLVFVFLGSFLSSLVALALTVAAGAVFELGQWDAARSIFSGKFPPGHGFGLLDLCADVTGALFALVLLAPTPHSTLVMIPQPAVAESAWAYVERCDSAGRTAPGHGLSDVAWAKDSLIVYSRFHNLLGFWRPRDIWPDGPAPDTITLDVSQTTVFKTIAHELLHHRRATVDTGDRHPDVPFVTPCDLMERPS